MRDLYMITYKITDRGIVFSEKTEEIPVKKGENVLNCVIKKLTKDRRSMDLSPKFTVAIIDYYKIGICK